MMMPGGTHVSLQLMRKCFESGRTRSLDFRRTKLTTLKDVIKKYEVEILDALGQDLGKSQMEAFMAEISFIYEEIRLAIRHLKSWSKPQKVRTPLLLQPGSSRIYTEPKGLVLIIAPWNYPIQLSLAPLVAAIAAGNCVVLKPSELAPATEDILRRLLAEAFSNDHCVMMAGGPEKTKELLSYRFDHIFFTGSAKVGKIIMDAAAQYLTPVTLELGGKSPCIVDQGFDLEVAARRIVWGKFYNAGQTCVAPDYVLVPERSKLQLVHFMKQKILDFYGVDPEKSPDYGRMIHEGQLDRILTLIEGGKAVVGGTHNRQSRYMAPTILDEVSLSSPLMQEEIFGPLLPVIGYQSLDQAIQIVKDRPHPLACYIFTNQKKTEQRLLEEISFGGGCINNTLLHLLNPRLPFGGVGQSGFGSYHGKFGFDLFSHRKPIYKSPEKIDIPLKYPPYKDRFKLFKKLLG